MVTHKDQLRGHATLQLARDARSKRCPTRGQLGDGVGGELGVQDRGGVEANAAGHLYLRG